MSAGVDLELRQTFKTRLRALAWSRTTLVVSTHRMDEVAHCDRDTTRPEDIDEVEADVFSNEWTNPAERIYFLKREVLEFQAATRPLVDPLSRLMRSTLPAVDSTLHEYFRDVYDHVVRVASQLDQYRDLLTSILEANLTQVGVRQNEDMRKISAWVAIAVVPTLIAGIFGMNFNRMPGVEDVWGFPAAIVVMAGAALALHTLFRRSGWL